MNKSALLILILFLLLIPFLPTSLLLALDDEASEEALYGGDKAAPYPNEPAGSKSIENREGLLELINLMEDFQKELFLADEIVKMRDDSKESSPERPKTDFESLKEKVRMADEEVYREEGEIPESGEISLEEKIRLVEDRLKEREDFEYASTVNFESKEKDAETEKALVKAKETKLTKKKTAEKKESEPYVYEEEKGVAREVSAQSETLIIEKEETVSLDVPGLKRVMSVDPNVITAFKQDSKVSITGNNLGNTFLHIWDSSGLHTLNVSVKYKQYKRMAKRSEKAKEEKRMKSFKVSYGFDRSRTNVKSDIASRSYHYTRWTHNLHINGETPWGMSKSKFLYEGEEEGRGLENKRDLSYWTVEMDGHYFDLSMGDTGGYFSNLTLPAQGFQGIRFASPEDRDVGYDFVAGARGARMWGYKIRDSYDDNYFWGGKFKVKPKENLTLYTMYMDAAEEEDNVAQYAYSQAASMDFFDKTVHLYGEAARSKSVSTDSHRHGYIANLSWNPKDLDLYLSGIYRDIDTNYLSVNAEGIPYQGIKGYFLTADYNPMQNLKIRGMYNLYRDGNNYNPSDKHMPVSESSVNAEYYLGNTRFSYSNFLNNYEGTSSPARSDGNYYGVSNTFALPEPFGSLNTSLGYSDFHSASLTSPSSDYKDKRLYSSMGFNVFKNLYYDLSHEWKYKKMEESGENGAIRTVSSGLRYGSRILESPFYGSMGLKYRKELDSIENLPLSAGESWVAGDASLTYNPGSGFSSYLTVNYKKVRGELDHDKNRRETRIYGGGNYSFDTTLRWGAGGVLKGYIFNDKNGNGVMEPGEEGIPDIVVYAGEDYTATSDKDGRYAFKKIKYDTVDVMYDSKLIPVGYKSTTANPMTVGLGRGLEKEVYFGVMSAVELNGMVFNDVDMNGIFDKDIDSGVKGAYLSLDDGSMIYTRDSGYYRLTDMSPGEKTITVDPGSLPFSLSPLTDIKRTILMEEGKERNEDFPLYALRTVIGYVFVDKNKNNKYDSKDEGVSDVVLECAGVKGITDGNGRYFLKKLPGKEQIIELQKDSLPKGYRLTSNQYVTIELKDDGEVKENVNFSVETR